MFPEKTTDSKMDDATVDADGSLFSTANTDSLCFVGLLSDVCYEQ
jgi:hypothetical protein